MFIERQCHPNIELDSLSGQQEPTLSFFSSTIAEPLKSTLPLLIGGEDERVLVVSSPLSEILDDLIRMY